MADSKSFKKSAPPASPGLLAGMTFGSFIALFLIASLFLKKNFPEEAQQNSLEVVKNFWLLLPEYATAVMLRLFSFSFILSIILLFGVVWASNNLMRIRRQMHEALKLPNTESIKEAKAIPQVVNEKWERVVTHINSTNPNDWKLAILECDIMLSDILEKMGYMQESISEKLKSIEPSDFTNIEAAWEAHKVRNQIAHEGSFMLNEREAKRVIGLYELVFQEFEYI